jgi:crotonobetainyl-CoA:carnitine CoA-transferase CaiB-like acyl-CoA transferase
MNIAAGNDAMWQKLARALGKPEWLSDARFDNAGHRIANRAELTAAIEGVLGQRDVDHWVGLLNDAGIPSGPVLNMEQVFSDPQVLARGMLVEMPHPQVGTFKTTGLPVKLGDTPGRIQRRPPLLGEHTAEVLRAAGLSDAELDALREAGIVKAEAPAA